MIRILTDEIAASFLLLIFLAVGFFGFGRANIVLYSVLAALFVCLYFFCFLVLKIFAPMILINQGRYEDCVAYCRRQVDGKYSLPNLLGIQKILNYFRISAAYGYMRSEDIERASDVLEKVMEEKVLVNQIIVLRLIRAHLLVNRHRFKEALDMLITLKTGSLSEKYLADIFYYISVCYLELDAEHQRALNYAKMAAGLKSHSVDYRLNYAVALYKCENNLIESKTVMNEFTENMNELSELGKQRLLYYLSKICKALGENDSSQRYQSMLNGQFPNSSYSRESVN